MTFVMLWMDILLCVLCEDWGGCDWHFLLCCLLDPKVLLLLLAVLVPFYCAAEMFSFNFNTLHQYCLKFVVIPISQRPNNMCDCEDDDGIVTRMNNNNILIGTKSNYHYIYTLLLCTWGTVSLSFLLKKMTSRKQIVIKMPLIVGESLKKYCAGAILHPGWQNVNCVGWEIQFSYG